MAEGVARPSRELIRRGPFARLWWASSASRLGGWGNPFATFSLAPEANDGRGRLRASSLGGVVFVDRRLQSPLHHHLRRRSPEPPPPTRPRSCGADPYRPVTTAPSQRAQPRFGVRHGSARLTAVRRSPPV